MKDTVSHVIRWEEKDSNGICSWQQATVSREGTAWVFKYPFVRGEDRFGFSSLREVLEKVFQARNTNGCLDRVDKLTW